jgi:hypothetical protein
VTAISYQINKPHFWFLRLRATYVNRLRRAGVSREAAMRMEITLRN